MASQVVIPPQRPPCLGQGCGTPLIESGTRQSVTPSNETGHRGPSDTPARGLRVQVSSWKTPVILLDFQKKSIQWLPCEVLVVRFGASLQAWKKNNTNPWIVW